MLYSQIEQLTYSQLSEKTYSILEIIYAVYDRTQSDVDNLTAKGLMNADDLNRLEINIDTVADIFAVPFIKKTWTKGVAEPRQSDYERWRVALTAIKSAYDTLQTVPLRPFNSYVKWNQLEYLLWYTDKIYLDNQSVLPYCGEFYCGEFGLI